MIDEQTKERLQIFSKEFTRVVRLEQRKSGLSIQDYAKKMGIKRSNMYKLLAGDRGLKLENSVKIMNILGYEINFTFNKVNKP